MLGLHFCLKGHLWNSDCVPGSTLCIIIILFLTMSCNDCLCLYLSYSAWPKLIIDYFILLAVSVKNSVCKEER